ncbi:hypothetical protein EJB05_01700, partial [Eragrostis curvula]
MPSAISNIILYTSFRIEVVNLHKFIMVRIKHHRDFYGGFKFGMYQKLLDQDDLVVMHDTGMTKAWA